MEKKYQRDREKEYTSVGSLRKRARAILKALTLRRGFARPKGMDSDVFKLNKFHTLSLLLSFTWALCSPVLTDYSLSRELSILSFATLTFALVDVYTTLSHNSRGLGTRSDDAWYRPIE